MRVRFFLKESPRPRDKDATTGAVKQVEYVEIHTGHDGKDVVVRPATAEDSAAHPAEYRAFKAPPAPTTGLDSRSAPEEVPADTVVDRKPGFFSRKK